MGLLDCASANSIWRGYDCYKGKLVCYFEVWDDGSIEQINVSKKGLSAAYERAVSGKTKIYAVWSGQWRSDLFIIDDLEIFAESVGI